MDMIKIKATHTYVWVAYEKQLNQHKVRMLFGITDNIIDLINQSGHLCHGQ